MAWEALDTLPAGMCSATGCRVELEDPAQRFCAACRPVFLGHRRRHHLLAQDELEELARAGLGSWWAFLPPNLEVAPQARKAVARGK